MDRRNFWIVAECVLCLLIYSAAFGAETKTGRMVTITVILEVDFYDKKALAVVSPQKIQSPTPTGTSRMDKATH